MIPGVQSFAPQSSAGIANATQAVATVTTYRPQVQSPSAVANLPQQRDPRAPWIAAYPTAPGMGVMRCDPTGATRCGPTTPLDRPSNIYVPRAPDPRPTLPFPVSASPPPRRQAGGVPSSASTGGL